MSSVEPKQERPARRDSATRVVKLLRGAGHEAYFAGGCVRDMLRGVPPKDFDIATSATPDEVIELFHRTIELGRAFGVIQVRLGGEGFEVATFRTETGYSDGRRPDVVRFSTAREDVQRRDFTINGLLYDPVDDRVIDYVGGQADLRAGIVRAIGEATERFREDKLRMLRAVRFASVLEFELDAATRVAIEEYARDISQVSAERIRVELLRTFGEGDAGRGLHLLDQTGLLEAIAGHTWRWLQPADRLVPALSALNKQEPLVALVMWWHALPSDEADAFAHRLRLSNEERKTLVEGLGALHELDHQPDADLAAYRRYLRQPHLPVALRAAELLSGHGVRPYPTLSTIRRDLATTPAEALRPPRLIDGTDLRRSGLAPGPAFGVALKAIENAQLRGEIYTRDQALAMVAELLDGT